jgi:hypothetical protein
MSWTEARSRVAGLHARAEDDPEKVDARLQLKYERMAERIRREVAESPPLSPEQRDRLAALLRAGAPA